MQSDRHTEPPKWMARVPVALGYFTVQSAMTSVPPVLPTLAYLFEVDVSQVSWAMTAYFLTVGTSDHA
jgi:predicted MFS family arabinose efflux permease